MANVIYPSAQRDALLGQLIIGTDTFRALLLATAAPDPSHSRRSQIGAEASGTGYTAGGALTVPTVSVVDTINRRVLLTVPTVNWASLTLSTTALVIYKSTGTAANDPLLCAVDFGTAQARAAQPLEVGPTVLTWQF